MKLLKNPIFIGNAIYWALKVIGKTLRIETVTDPKIDYNTQYLCSFWHGKQLLPSLLLRKMHGTPQSVLVSPSRDGTIAATFLNKLGYEVLRGSSRAGNVKALRDMNARVEQGHSIGTPVDGPLGPKYDVKPGMVFLAKQHGLTMVPVGSAFKSKWILKNSWDDFEIPKPFSKVALVLGEPLSIDSDTDIKAACAKLAQRIHEAEAAAQKLISN